MTWDFGFTLSNEGLPKNVHNLTWKLYPRYATIPKMFCVEFSLLLTIYIYFTETTQCEWKTGFKIKRRIFLIVLDDVSPVVTTGDVDKVRYCGISIFGVPN